MKLRLKRLHYKELGWFVALAAILTLLLGAAIVKLDQSDARAEALRADIEGKLKLLRSRSVSAQDRAALLETEGALAQWEQLAASQADRIATLSSAAKTAGASLVALRDLEPRLLDEGRVTAHAHRVSVAGGYREIGMFLDELNGGRSVIAVEDLTIGRDEEGDSGLVQASLQVTWFAPSAPDAPQEDGEQ